MIALGYYGAEVYDISMPFPTGPLGFAKSRATIRENPGKIGVLGATKRAEVELSRHIRPSEDRCGDETMTGGRVHISEPLTQGDADRAHGDVDRALAKALEHAPLAEHNPFDGAVVREHGDDRITLAGICHSSGQVRTPIDQPLRLARRAIVDGDFVASLEQASGHCGSHVPEADESDFHDWAPVPDYRVTVALLMSMRRHRS